MTGIGDQRHRAADEACGHFDHDEYQIERYRDREAHAARAGVRKGMAVSVTVSVVMMAVSTAHGAANRTSAPIA